MELGLFFITLGVAIMAFGFITWYGVLSRRWWPLAFGTILANEEQVEGLMPNDQRGGVLSMLWGKLVGRGSRKLSLRLRYVYVVGEYKYFGSRLYSSVFLHPCPTRISGLGVGDKIKVFYHRKYPERCFLAQSYVWPGVLCSVAGAVLLFIGVVYLYLS